MKKPSLAEALNRESDAYRARAAASGRYVMSRPLQRAYVVAAFGVAGLLIASALGVPVGMLAVVGAALVALVLLVALVREQRQARAPVVIYVTVEEARRLTAPVPKQLKGD